MIEHSPNPADEIDPINDDIKITVHKKKGSTEVNIDVEGEFRNPDWTPFAVLMEAAYTVIGEVARKHNCPDGMNCTSKMGSIQMYNALTNIRDTSQNQN